MKHLDGKFNQNLKKAHLMDEKDMGHKSLLFGYVCTCILSGFWLKKGNDPLFYN